MLSKLRRHLTYANVMSTLAAFFALAGGAAYAANTVFSTDIVDNEVRTADVRNDTLSGGGLGGIDIANDAVTTLDVRDDTQGFGGLFAQDLAAGSVRSSEVQDNSILLQDLAQVARDSCPAGTSRFGDICAAPAGTSGRTWGDSLNDCAANGLRVPTLPEATVLGQNYDIPGLPPNTKFWTDESYGLQEGGSLPQYAFTSDEDGALFSAAFITSTSAVVCVTDLSDGG